MSERSCSLGSTVFFEAQLLFMHECPHRSIVHLQPTFGELGHEPAQGEGVRDAFPQPVGMRTLQNAWLMTAHLSRRDAARRPKSLRPFHHAGRADAQRCCHSADAPASDPPSKWWTPLISSYWSWKGV